MSDIEKKIKETFDGVVPKLNALEMEKLLAFGEGMAYMVETRPLIGGNAVPQNSADVA